MNADSRMVAIHALRTFFVGLRLHPDEASYYTPNKVIRRYLKETTLVRAPVPAKGASIGLHRSSDFWTALFFGSALGTQAKHSMLYTSFVKDVLQRSGITVNTASTCSVATHELNCVTEWQVMALFYMSGDSVKVIRSVLAGMNIVLSAAQEKVLPLNMHAFAMRCRKMEPLDYDMHLGDMTLDADYAIITSISMADLDPDAVIVIDGTSTSVDKGKRRREVIVAPATDKPRRSDMVKWTAIETQLFELDDRWNRFKVAACLSPQHPPLWTIRVYLAHLPKPPVIIPHAQFVLDYMPYFDVSAVVHLPEVQEFAKCLKAGGEKVDGWPAAKLITRLVWFYDPYSTGASATRHLVEYAAKYPRLTTPFICGLVTTY